MGLGSGSEFDWADPPTTTNPTTTIGAPAEDDQLMGFPPDFDWANVQPIYATGDLIYNDLMGNIAGDDGMPPSWLTGGGGGGGNGDGGLMNELLANNNNNGGVGGHHDHQRQGEQQQQQQQHEGIVVGSSNSAAMWRINGEFGNDSVWSLLNQYAPI